MLVLYRAKVADTKAVHLIKKCKWVIQWILMAACAM